MNRSGFIGNRLGLSGRRDLQGARLRHASGERRSGCQPERWPQFNAAVASEPACANVRFTTLDNAPDVVPGHNLTVSRFQPDPNSDEWKWNWIMDGLTFSGMADNLPDAAKGICKVVLAPGATVPNDF